VLAAKDPIARAEALQWMFFERHSPRAHYRRRRFLAGLQARGRHFCSSSSGKCLSLFFCRTSAEKNDPENSGVIFHQGLVVSCRLVAFERRHGRLATLPAA
jgi:hypothetical protein